MSKFPLELENDLKLVNNLFKKTSQPNKKAYNLEQIPNNITETYCKVTTKNKIKFCNKDFEKSTGYTKKEILSADYNLIFHTDMPKVIQTIIKHRVNTNKSIVTIVKNRHQNGNYFWTLSHFKPNTNEHNLNIAFTVKSKPIHRDAKKKIDNLYLKLLKIEKHHDTLTASKYLFGFLEEMNMSLSQYCINISS